MAQSNSINVNPQTILTLENWRSVNSSSYRIESPIPVIPINIAHNGVNNLNLGMNVNVVNYDANQLQNNDAEPGSYHPGFQPGAVGAVDGQGINGHATNEFVKEDDKESSVEELFDTQQTADEF